MANHPSAEKRNRQRIVRTERNRALKSALRTTIKKARAAVGAGSAKDAKPLVAAEHERATASNTPTGGGDARPVGTASGAARAEKVVLDDEQKAKGQSAQASRPSSSAGMRPAEFNANGGVADRPSTGAAQAAVGAVLGAARSCIAGQPQASSATIHFGSGGEVTGVSVNGPAQGTPAAPCIQSALQKARVQPFAAPTFSLAVTIRPP